MSMLQEGKIPHLGNSNFRPGVLLGAEKIVSLSDSDLSGRELFSQVAQTHEMTFQTLIGSSQVCVNGQIVSEWTV